jgi:hypothetical protein
MLAIERERERERERAAALLGTTVHNGGSRAAPAARTPHHHALSCFPTHPWRSSILHGEDFPRTLMTGSPDGAVKPVRHRQETLDLAAWRQQTGLLPSPLS